MGGEAVTQGMTAGRLADAGLAHRTLHRTLDGLLVRIAAEIRGWEQVLPAPLGGGLRVFAGERKRRRDARPCAPSLLLVPGPQPREMPAQRRIEDGGQHG